MMAAEVRQQNRVYPSEKCLGANCAQVLVSLSAIVKPSPALHPLPCHEHTERDCVKSDPGVDVTFT
jgi:hypothetical protein